MGDRTYTSIRFSGVIDADKVPQLVQAMRDDYLNCDSTGNSDWDESDLTDSFYAEEANYGQLGCTEAACKELGVSFRTSWNAGGDYGPGMKIYNAVVDQEFECADLDGDPVVGLNELIKAHEAGKIDDTIGFLKVPPRQLKAAPRR
jgi:hypothetical protein